MLTGSPLLFCTQNDFMDLEHVRTSEHLRWRTVAVGNAERLAVGPVPECLFTLPVGLYQVVALLRRRFPLARLVVKTALHGTQHMVLDESRRAVDEMGAMAKAVFECGFMACGNGDTVGDDEHDESSSLFSLKDSFYHTWYARKNM